MIKLTSIQASAFVSDACTQIKNSHDDAWNDITTAGLKRAQYEAQFVARLCTGARNIATSWRPRIRRINSSLRLSFASVFTHQSPYVKWSTAHRCELADLLIAIIDRTTAPEMGMAVLIQAKQSDISSTHLASHSEKEQFDLLRGRPTFDVDAKIAPSGVDLMSYRPDNALMYGLAPPDAMPVKSSAWSSHRWETADGLGSIPLPYHITASACLADGLVEQLQKKRGWSFELPPAKKDWKHFTSGANLDHWSALINYLLQVTFAKPLNQLKSSAGSPPDRGLDEPLYLIGRTPKGKITFAVVDYDSIGSGEEPFDWIGLRGPGRLSEVVWRPTDAIPWANLGGDNNIPGAGGGGRSNPLLRRTTAGSARLFLRSAKGEKNDLRLFGLSKGLSLSPYSFLERVPSPYLTGFTQDLTETAHALVGRLSRVRINSREGELATHNALE